MEEGPGKFSRGKTIHVDEAELQAHLEGLPPDRRSDALVVESPSLPPPLPRRRSPRIVLILGVAVVLAGIALGVGAGYWMGFFDTAAPPPAPEEPALGPIAPIALDAVRVDLDDANDSDSSDPE